MSHQNSRWQRYKQRKKMLGVMENRNSETKACSEIPTEIQVLTFPYVDAICHNCIRYMLASFTDMWRVNLGRIDAVEDRIGVKQYGRPFRFAYYRVRPKTRVFEKLKI